MVEVGDGHLCSGRWSSIEVVAVEGGCVDKGPGYSLAAASNAETKGGLGLGIGLGQC